MPQHAWTWGSFLVRQQQKHVFNKLLQSHVKIAPCPRGLGIVG